jgi:hypothetical protein
MAFFFFFLKKNKKKSKEKKLAGTSIDLAEALHEI